jgi:hypothetical protein
MGHCCENDLCVAPEQMPVGVGTQPSNQLQLLSHDSHWCSTGHERTLDAKPSLVKLLIRVFVGALQVISLRVEQNCVLLVHHKHAGMPPTRPTSMLAASMSCHFDVEHAAHAAMRAPLSSRLRKRHDAVAVARMYSTIKSKVAGKAPTSVQLPLCLQVWKHNS